MRAVVTGGAGFIGSHLVDRLLSLGHEVLVVDDLSTGVLGNLKDALESPRCSLVEADILSETSSDAIAGFGPDVVFHLAAQSAVRVSAQLPALDAQVNIAGSVTVFEAARRGGARCVVAAASGGTLYGGPSEDLYPLSEGAPWLPVSPYGISKKAMIDYLRYFSEEFGLNTVALALGNVYGPRQNPHGEAGVVAIFSKKLLAGEQPIIFGTGTNTRDYVYVGDVVEAFCAAGLGNVSGHHVVNIASGTENSVLDVLADLVEVSGTHVSAQHAPACPGEPRRVVLDIEAAQELLSWAPQVDLRTGLLLTYEAMRAAS